MSAAVQLISRDHELGRDLLEEYEDCAWRETKLEILRELSHYPQPRIIEFLVNCASQIDDLPIAESAVGALGRSKSPIAARFLLHFLDTCPQIMLPAVVSALGQLRFSSAAPHLKELFLKAQKQNLNLLSRNCLLALAELKHPTSVPLLEKICEEVTRSEQMHTDPQSQLSAMMALGKVSQNPNWFEANSHWPGSDLFKHQVFTNSTEQTLARYDCNFTDVLKNATKLGEQKKVLSEEVLSQIDHVDENALLETIKKWDPIKNHAIICQIIKRRFFAGIGVFCENLVRSNNWTHDEKLILLQALCSHHNSELRACVIFLKPQVDSALWPQWLVTVTYALPDALTVLDGLYKEVNFEKESDSVFVSYINALAECAIINKHDDKKIRRVVKSLSIVLQDLLPSKSAEQIKKQIDTVYLPKIARTLRAFGQLAARDKFIDENLGVFISRTALQSSVGWYLLKTKHPSAFEVIFPELQTWQKKNSDLDSSTLMILLKALAAADVPLEKNKDELANLLTKLFDKCSSNHNNELLCSLLKVTATHSHKSYVGHIQKSLEHADIKVRIFAILAARNSKEATLVNAVSLGLKHKDRSISGRAFDCLLQMNHTSSNIAAFNFMEQNFSSLEHCEKFLRDFKSLPTDTPYFLERLEKLNDKLLNHPLADAFAKLKETIQNQKELPRAQKNANMDFETAAPLSGHLATIERSLSSRVTGFQQLHSDVKSALRAAETPFFQQEIFNNQVDKSGSVLGYAKALDLLLEDEFGKRKLFPEMEKSLAQFQNRLYLLELNQEYPQFRSVLKALDLEQHFLSESLPLHKMSSIARSTLSSRIFHENSKVLDGLRAWSAAILMFSLPSSNSSLPNPLVCLEGATRSELISFAKRLIKLQEIRNPIAHRQTLVDFVTLDFVRNEVFELIKIWRKF